MKITDTLKMIIRKILLSVFILCSFSQVSALTVSPARFEVNADPGATTVNEFTVVNEQNVDQVFYTSIENFEAQGDSGTPNFTRGTNGLATWIKTEEKILIKAGEKMKIPFSVIVPKDADAGGHFAAIFLSTQPPSTKGGEVSVGAKVGMLVLLTVSGDIKENGGVSSFGLLNGKRVVTSLPVDFVYRFKNSGNDRAKPVGSISIRNMIGLETESLNANPNEGNILPGSTRRFDIRWGTEEPIAISAPFFDHVKYEFRNFALGAYMAKLNVSFGLNSTSKSNFLFLVLPWHLMIVILIIALVVFLILKAALNKYNRFIINQARMMAGNMAPTEGHANKKKTKSSQKKQ